MNYQLSVNADELDIITVALTKQKSALQDWLSHYGRSAPLNISAETSQELGKICHLLSVIEENK